MISLCICSWLELFVAIAVELKRGTHVFVTLAVGLLTAAVKKQPLGFQQCCIRCQVEYLTSHVYDYAFTSNVTDSCCHQGTAMNDMEADKAVRMTRAHGTFFTCLDAASNAA